MACGTTCKWKITCAVCSATGCCLLADYPGCQRPDDPGVGRFADLVAGARVKPMGKGSHFLPMEYPDEVLAAAKQWFDAIPHAP